MIQKMHYITLTGPLSHVDWAIEHYLSRHKIHLEYATRQLQDMPGLRVLTTDNPYQESAARGTFFLEILKDTPPVYFPTTGKQALATIEMAHQQYEARSQHLKGLERERDIINTYIDSLNPFAAFDAELRLLDSCRHFRCLFGRMPIKNFLQFEAFLYEENPILFAEAFRDKETVWGCFFVMTNEASDRLLAPYHFEHLSISATCLNEEIPGTPIEIITYWEKRLVELQTRIQKMTEENLPQKNILLAACHTVRHLHRIFTIKQYAAQTSGIGSSLIEASDIDVSNVKTSGGYYIFVGWMAQADALILEKETVNDEMIIFAHYEAVPEAASEVVSKAVSRERVMPPTQLVNPPLIRWFEFFVKLYGTPQYTEIDPTPILAAAYTLLFGMMFGDVGHGLGLALIGWFLLQKHRETFKHRAFQHQTVSYNGVFQRPQDASQQLGGIMIMAGLSSAIFGVLYGSIFGMEDWIPALWRHPIRDITGTLWIAVALGIVMIFLVMALNMINAFKQKDFQKLFFGPNGAAGMVLYILIITAVAGIVPWAVIAAPLTVIVIKGMSHQSSSGSGDTTDPDIKIRPNSQTSLPMIIFQRALGIFEILLAYLTNTISFVRVGAFALSHAGMMHVVMMLSQQTAESPATEGLLSVAGIRNVLVFVLGNLVVMGIEGLLIGIQSLRLGFYEIFSRFYEGGGRDFESSISQ